MLRQDVNGAVVEKSASRRSADAAIPCAMASGTLEIHYYLGIKGHSVEFLIIVAVSLCRSG
jgi:hypothetical protein